MDKEKEDELKAGFVVPLLTRFFDIVGRFMLVRGTSLKVRGKILIQWTAGAIEAYVLFCLGAEVLLLGLLFAWPSLSNNWGFFITVPILLSYRVLDMLRAGFNWLIIAPYRRLQIISTPRLLILSLINYVELAVIFGVIAFLARNGFHPQFQSAWHSFYYSVSVITLLGANIEPVSVQSRVVSLSEIGLALTFLLLIIARAVSLLPHPKG